MNDISTELILSLIKAEMKNYKLIAGLTNAGALIEHFHTDLDLTIFNLLLIDQENKELFYLIYDKHMDKLEELPLNEFWDSLDDLAISLYIELLAEKSG